MITLTDPQGATLSLVTEHIEGVTTVDYQEETHTKVIMTGNERVFHLVQETPAAVMAAMETDKATVLRDEIAKAAVSGIASKVLAVPLTDAEVASHAYGIADAMLIERTS